MNAVFARASAADVALRLVEPDQGRVIDVDADVDDGERLAVAWALKDLCYASWSIEPQRAVRAAAALRRLCRGLDDDTTEREIHALAAWTGGIAAILEGRMDDAVAALVDAEARFLSATNQACAAQTLVARIMALSMLGRNDEAVACARRARQSFIAMKDVRSAGKVSLNLGALQVRRGAFAQAATHSREAAVFFARPGDHENSVMADINLADALTALGDFDEALRIHARARMRAGTHGFPVLEALVDESAGLLQLARGRYREALVGLERSRSNYERLGMPQQLAIAEQQLADAYLELRLLPEALGLFERALRRFHQLAMPAEQAWTCVQIGRTHALLGHADAASAALQTAASLFDAQAIPLGVATVALARAELALVNDAPVEAHAHACRAVDGFATAAWLDRRLHAELVRADALRRLDALADARAVLDATLARARVARLLTIEVRCLVGLGSLARATGDVAATRAACTQAVTLFEQQRQALPWDELRSALLADHLRPYEELLRLALDDGVAEDVLVALDRFRARSLDERVSNGVRVDDDPSTLALRERLRWLNRRVAAGADDAALWNDEIRAAETELLERARRTRLVAPLPAMRHDAVDDFSIAALRATLNEGDALVEYGRADDELFACVVTRDRVTVHRRMAGWSAVCEALRAARFQIDALRHGAAPVERLMAGLCGRAQARMRALHALLWAPLVDRLANCSRVVVVPHAQLGTLAFGALVDADARVLVTRHELAIAPSARLAVRGLQHAMGRPSSVVVYAESSRLPQAAMEARRVAGLFEQADVAIDADATLARLDATIADADVVHFACHAEFRSDNPMFSALHLHDGPLTVEHVEGLALRAGLVVLAACETGVAQVGGGDETVGLVRAFLVAGAARVVASLWPVDDTIAALFMTTFYAALGRGLDPARALRDAQLVVREAHPHPAQWAAFVLHGGW